MTSLNTKKKTKIKHKKPLYSYCYCQDKYCTIFEKDFTKGLDNYFKLLRELMITIYKNYKYK